jgi:hypothetical protein
MSWWLLIFLQIILAIEVIIGIKTWITLGATMERDKKRRQKEAAVAANLVLERDNESKVTASSPKAGSKRQRRLSVFNTLPARCRVNPFGTHQRSPSSA